MAFSANIFVLASLGLNNFFYFDEMIFFFKFHMKLHFFPLPEHLSLLNFYPFFGQTENFVGRFRKNTIIVSCSSHNSSPVSDRRKFVGQKMTNF